MEHLELIIAMGIFLTSFLSGIMGMGGGMLLMALLVSLLPIETAMVLHGCTQMAANGSRAYFHRSSIQGRLILGYLLGAALAFSLFKWLQFTPSKKVVLLFLGLFPLVSFIPSIGPVFSINKPRRPQFCGFFVTIAQLMAGASGGVLDVFYQQSPLSRFQIVAGKAMTQALTHGIKIIFFLPMYLNTWKSESSSIGMELFPIAILLATWGSFAGKKVLTHLSEHNFRKYSQALILLIAVLLIYRGLSLP